MTSASALPTSGSDSYRDCMSLLPWYICVLLIVCYSESPHCIISFAIPRRCETLETADGGTLEFSMATQNH